jgi:hypothetical protein
VLRGIGRSRTVLAPVGLRTACLLTVYLRAPFGAELFKLRVKRLSVGADSGVGARQPHAPVTHQDLVGFSDPIPLGVFIVSQVPFGTYFQAVPS